MVLYPTIARGGLRRSGDGNSGRQRRECHQRRRADHSVAEERSRFRHYVQLCQHLIGVWSESSADRTVVVAVYGQSRPPGAGQDAAPLPSAFAGPAPTTPIGPFPDYDASNEIQYGINWLPLILRGVYPAPAYPPS